MSSSTDEADNQARDDTRTSRRIKSEKGASRPLGRRPRRTPNEFGETFVGDGMRIGLVMAGIGLLFVMIFAGSELVWGSYFGADPAVGLSLSFGVMTVGVAIATGLWILREVATGASSALRKRRRVS